MSPMTFPFRRRRRRYCCCCCCCCCCYYCCCFSSCRCFCCYYVYGKNNDDELLKCLLLRVSRWESCLMVRERRQRTTLFVSCLFLLMFPPGILTTKGTPTGKNKESRESMESGGTCLENGATSTYIRLVGSSVEKWKKKGKSNRKASSIQKSWKKCKDKENMRRKFLKSHPKIREKQFESKIEICWKHRLSLLRKSID